MKSLVLKDLFNIGHNAKSMLFILVVFAVALIPFSGVEGYIFVCAILCSMMIVTTFSFDDSSKWTRYAMIMPVSKKELVAGKFMVLAIFCAIGSLFGLIIGFIGGLITDKIVLDIVGIGELLFLTLVASDRRKVCPTKHHRRVFSSAGLWRNLSVLCPGADDTFR